MTVPLYFGNTPIGEINVGPEGPTFTYARSWVENPSAFPLSLRMPLGQMEFAPKIVMPWLMNLLPENPHLANVGQWLGISPQDIIGLLEKIGRDVAGAASVGQPRPGDHPHYRTVESDADLERIIEELPKRPFLVGEEGVSMSLAGAQDKLPVALQDGRIAIPVEGEPSTHILKPDNKHLFGSVQNEALCLVLARLCGMRVANATTGKAGGRSYLLVDRYDRVPTDKGWQRIHQEDFCQALGKPPSAKYERNQSGIRGPHLHDMFALIKQHMTAADQVRFLDAVIFNVLICNTDAHAKNYSIVLGPRRAELAPLYDLNCADAWDGITRNLAQTIGEKNRGDHIHRRHWERMAKECGLRAVAVIRRVEELANEVGDRLNTACDIVREMPAGDHTMLPHFADAIRRRCTTVKVNLKDTSDNTSTDR